MVWIHFLMNEMRFYLQHFDLQGKYNIMNNCKQVCVCVHARARMRTRARLHYLWAPSKIKIHL